MNKTNYNTSHDQWVRENTMRLSIKINRKKEADLVSALEQSNNMQGFIKNALRYYIAHGCPGLDESDE